MWNCELLYEVNSITSKMMLSALRKIKHWLSLLVLSQTEETGRGTENTVTPATATSHGRETDITHMTPIATRITTVNGVHMEMRIAAREVIATTAPLEKGLMSNTAMTGTTGVTDPITTGDLLRPCDMFWYLMVK